MSDSNDKQLPTGAANPVVEQILRFRFPLLQAFQAAHQWKGELGEATKPVTGDYVAKVQVERARLLALPPKELATMLQTYLLSEQKKKQDQAAQKLAKKRASDAADEAAKFYNRPDAIADLDYWAKADYWTLEESLALLLGKNPKLVTFAAMKRELEPGFTFLMTPSQRPPLSEFVEQYQRLRMLAERAGALKNAHLNPKDVIAWAHRVKAVTIPALLRSLLPLDQSEISLTQTSIETANGKEALPIEVQNIPAQGTPKKWTEENLRKLAAFREEKGTQAAAEEFGISTARVRQLLPNTPSNSKKPEPRGPWGGLYR